MSHSLAASLLLVALLPGSSYADESAEEEPAETEAETGAETEAEIGTELPPEPEPPPPPDQTARTALEEERWADAIHEYGLLLTADPLAADVPAWREALVHAHLNLGHVPEALGEAARLQADLGGDWRPEHAGDDPALQAGQASLEAALLHLANHYRDVARDRPEDAAELFQLAVQWYGALADQTAAGDRAQEALLEMAQVHYATGQYAEAYDRAMEAVDAQPGSLRCRLACELAIYASRRMASSGAEVEADWPGKQLAALDRFTELYPRDFMTQDVLFESAQLLAEQQQHDQSTPRLLRVVDLEPATPTAERAAHLLLESLQTRRDWATLAQVAEKLLTEELRSPELKRELGEAHDRASFHLIEEEYVQAEDWLGAAEAFQQFSEQFPDSSLADRALYNAIVFYYKAGRSRTASHQANVLRRRFPHSPYIDRLQL